MSAECPSCTPCSPQALQPPGQGSAPSPVSLSDGRPGLPLACLQSCGSSLPQIRCAARAASFLLYDDLLLLFQGSGCSDELMVRLRGGECHA